MSLDANLKKPLIISCALTGSGPTRKDNPSLPYTPKELIQSAVESAEAGASIVHIHVREPDGTPSNRQELYAEALAGIRERSDVLVCFTTGSGGHRFHDRARMTALPCGPDLASFDAGSMNFGEGVFENSPAFLRSLATEITSRDILPEIECFDVGQVMNAVRLGDEGLLPGKKRKWWFQFCAGVRGGIPCDARVLLAMRDLLPLNSEWSVLGVGRAQLPAALIALVEGGHIRTGLEDNVYLRRGELATGNAQLVRRVADLAREVSRPIATPSIAREMLQLNGARPIVGTPIGAGHTVNA